MILFDYTWLQKAVAFGSEITECQEEQRLTKQSVKLEEKMLEEESGKWEENITNKSIEGLTSKQTNKQEP